MVLQFLLVGILKKTLIRNTSHSEIEREIFLQFVNIEKLSLFIRLALGVFFIVKLKYS